MFSHPKIFFLTFCSTIEFNPYLPLKFLIFYHSSLCIIIFQQAQKMLGYRCLSNNYACLQVLILTHLHDKAAV